MQTSPGLQFSACVNRCLRPAQTALSPLAHDLPTSCRTALLSLSEYLAPVYDWKLGQLEDLDTLDITRAKVPNFVHSDVELSGVASATER